MTNSSPKSSKQQLQQIYQLIRQNNQPEARRLLQQYFKDNVPDADAYYIATFLTNDIQRKIQLCERALQINPNHGPVLQLLEKLHAAPKEAMTSSGQATKTASVDTPKQVTKPTPTPDISDDLADAIPSRFTGTWGDMQAKKSATKQVNATKSASNNNGLVLVLGLLLGLILIATVGALVVSRLGSQPTPPSIAQINTITALPIPATNTPITKVAPKLPTLAPAPTLTRRPTRTSVPTIDPLYDTGETATPNRDVDGATLTPTLPLGAQTLNNPVRKIPYLIEDAEYSTSLDRIIFIAIDPNVLQIYDPESQAKQTVTLERKPIALSVSRDGKFAVVGHDALVTYIDLQTASIIKTLSLSTRVVDIVLLDTGWIVVTPPQEGGSKPFRLLNVNDNTEISADTLPPYSSGFMLRQQDGLSVYYGARDMEFMNHYLFDESGKLTEARQAPYSGREEICGNLWSSGDGKQLIGRCGAVFNSSANAQRDMTYAGSLPDVAKLDGVVNADSQRMFIALGYPLIGERYDTDKFIPPYPLMIFMFDQITLRRKALVALPMMASGYKATSGYLFLNAAQTRYYALLKRNGRVHPDGSIEAMNEIEFGLVTGRADGSPDQVVALSTEVSTEVMLPSATMTPTDAPTPLPTPSTLAAPDVVGDIQRLDYRVQHAEYSKSLNRIVMISDNPPTLHVYDPVKGAEQTVSLSQPPIVLSVSPDGKFAAVGHKALITYVDLQAATVIKTLDVTFEVNNILLASNGWVYASGQDEHQFNAQVGIELETGRRGQGFQGSAKRHPNGDVYAQTSHEPRIDHIVLTDPANPQIILNHYYGNYCGTFWVTEDGKRIVTWCSTVLRASLDAKLDLSDNGKLEFMSNTSGFDYSQISGKAVAVGASWFFTGEYAEQLVVYSYDTLSADKFMAMPTMTIDGMPLATRGNYVFFDSDGFNYYVVLQNATTTLEEVVYHGVAHLRLKQTPSALTSTPTVAQTAVPTAASDLDMLDFAVTHAAYSKPLDRIIMTTVSPHQVVIYNPADRSKITVVLDSVANSLRLSSDGLSAVIGHDGLLSIIDLRAAKVLATYPIAANVFDAVLATNGFIYATPKHSDTPVGKVDAYSIKLSSGDVQKYQDDSVGNTNATLHMAPDGSYFYYVLADDGGMTSIYRIGIEKSGELSKPIRWSNRTNHGTCFSVWFTEDDTRLLTACGSLLKVSKNPDEDIIYNGVLSQSVYQDGTMYLWMTDSAVANVILAFPDVEQLNSRPSDKHFTQQILMYNSDTLQLIRAIDPPLMITTRKQAHTIGQYAFINAAGDRYYVILKAEPEAGLLNDYAVWNTPLTR